MSAEPFHPAWLNSIDDPVMYSHPVSEIQLMETHISWVILTGDWTYKLKKPVNFDFVDFSTLELRHSACREEVRLNRRTAPDLYDDVVPLTTDADGPRFGGSGVIVEYAVRMRQFSQADLFEQYLARKELSFEIIETLAHRIADLHLHADVASVDTSFGELDVIRTTVHQCFDVLLKTSLPEAIQNSLDALEKWTASACQRLTPVFAQRKQQGWVRECHGDLHLGNLVVYRGMPTLFDCLEFNPQLRWIDVFSDIAFLLMDLLDHGQSPLAWRALNQWLEETGDYEGLQVLRYYLSYRALVRAKVAALRLRQSELSAAEVRSQNNLLESYVSLATQLTLPSKPVIVLMHGFSGSGKSFVARHFGSSLEAVRIRSDVERKRMMEGSPQRTPAETYSNEANRNTYRRLAMLAKAVVGAGYPVIIDAAFLKRADRQIFASLAAEVDVPLIIVSCIAPDNILRERIIQRGRVGRDASEADVNVLERQLATSEPLEPSELHSPLVLDTVSDDISLMIDALRNRIRGATSGV